MDRIVIGEAPSKVAALQKNCSDDERGDGYRSNNTEGVEGYPE